MTPEQKDLHVARIELLKYGKYFHLPGGFPRLSKILELEDVPSNRDVFNCDMNMVGLLEAIKKSNITDSELQKFMERLDILYRLLPKQNIYIRVHTYVAGSDKFIHPRIFTDSSELDEYLGTLKPYWEDEAFLGIWFESRDKMSGTYVITWDENNNWTDFLKAAMNKYYIYPNKQCEQYGSHSHVEYCFNKNDNY